MSKYKLSQNTQENNLRSNIESSLTVFARRRLPIATKYMQDLWREKTILLFFGLLFFIALSVSLLLLTLSFIYNPDALLSAPIAVGIIGSSPAYSELALNPKIIIYQYDNISDALNDFDNQTISAVFSTRIEDGVIIVDSILPTSPVTSAVILAISKDAFGEAQEILQQKRINDRSFVWPQQIGANNQQIRGTDTLYAIILGLIIPLFVLIPSFVIGNLFVDTLTQDFEQKIHQSVFSVISPIRYVLEYLLFGAVANTVIVFCFAGLLFLRFSFVKNFWLIMLYSFIFGIVLFLFSMNCSFYLKRKEVAQTVYSFGVVALFLFAPFFSLSPLFVLTELLIGNTLLLSTSFALLSAATVFLFFMLYYKLSKEYYL